MNRPGTIDGATAAPCCTDAGCAATAATAARVALVRLVAGWRARANEWRGSATGLR